MTNRKHGCIISSQPLTIALILYTETLSLSSQFTKKEKEIAADKARQEGKPENMIEKIAMGRIGKFYKEVCLLKQEYIQDGKMTVAEYLKSVDKDLTVTAFKRFTLRAE